MVELVGVGGGQWRGGGRKPGKEISGVISREEEGRGLLLNYQRRTRSAITETAGGRWGLEKQPI